jgi:molybdenum cofactor cytidylyltransferase
VKFGPVPVGEASGAILAHSVRHATGVIRKGRVLGDDDIAVLRRDGIADVVVARLGPEDVHEDAAAEEVARAIAGEGVRVERPFTGRSNLYAEAAGVFVADRALIDRINAVDPAITVATLPEYASVAAGQMVATVKVIPFAAARAAVGRATELAARPATEVMAYRPLRVGLVATELPALKRSAMDKTRRLLDERLSPAGAAVMREDRVAHDTGTVAASLIEQKTQGADLLVVFGASAVVDADDVIPAAIERAGGRVVRFGMPVDPGNLLVLGEIGDVPVIGAPGCARSPSENGFDWVLNRLLAGIDVTAEDIASLGVGGLLMEIVSRPQPREEPPSPRPKVAALLLAAGSSRRMGGPNKLVATIGGRPLVRIAAEAAVASAADSLTVVTGHQAGEIEAALKGLQATIVHNPDHANGLSTSLRAGLARIPSDADAIVVLLGDMPGVTAAMIDREIDAFNPAKGAEIVVPSHVGQRGSPVLWSRRFFGELAAVEGDKGGRDVISAHRDVVAWIDLGPATALDVDTPEALAAAGGVPA